MEVSKYRPEIDGLRAFAVVAVIINHFNRDLLPSGHLGVDIFFVISGYVITSSLAARTSASFGSFIGGFYERRIKRIIPALVFFVLVNSFLIALFNEFPERDLTIGIRSLMGISNITLYRGSWDYFSISNEFNPFMQTWSLGVEEQFYFIFPFLIWFSGFGKKTQNGSRNLLKIILGLSIISCFSFCYFYKFNQPAAYFLMQNRFWEMASGCITYLILEKRGSLLNTRKRKLASIFIILSIALTFTFPLHYAIFSTLLIIVLTNLLILLLDSSSCTYAILTNKYILRIGLLSYSLYLWHWGILAISRWTVGIHWWTVPIQIILIIVISNYSYRFIETPFRKASWGRTSLRTIIYGIVSLILSISSIITFQRIGTKYVVLQSKNTELLTPWWSDRDGNYIEKCHLQKEFKDEYLKSCLTSQGGRKNRLFLIGDSHARNYLGALRNLLSSHEVKYLTMGNRCGFYPLDLIEDKVEEKVFCSKYVRNIKNYLAKEANEGDIVFIGQSLSFHDYDMKASEKYFSFIRNFSLGLAEQKVAVVLLDGTAPPPAPYALMCYKEPWRPFPSLKVCSSGRDEVLNRYKKFDDLAKASSKKTINMFYSPLRDGLCEKDICSQFTSNGTQVWHDSGHITDSASRELSPILKQRLIENGFNDYFADKGLKLEYR